MRRRRQGLQVSTFPFLAVLLCTMGSLILLLLVIDRRAKVVARARALRAAMRVQEEETKVDAARTSELDQRRQTLHDLLTRQNMEVLTRVKAVQGQAEEAAKTFQGEQTSAWELRARLQEQAASLKQRQAALTARGQDLAQNNQQTRETRAELAKMTEELLQLERTLADLRLLRQKDQQTYSLVPYRGRSGDNRKPLYVECMVSGLVFHPDRMTLEGGDLSSPGIRAEVERRIQRQQKKEPPQGGAGKNAYLLLLVRPDGITNYYRTLEAVDGLPLDFGYEFIEADWLLDFPTNEDEVRSQPWMVADSGSSSPVPSTAPPKASVPPLIVPSRPRGLTHGMPPGEGKLPGQGDPSGTVKGIPPSPLAIHSTPPGQQGGWPGSSTVSGTSPQGFGPPQPAGTIASLDSSHPGASLQTPADPLGGSNGSRQGRNAGMSPEKQGQAATEPWLHNPFHTSPPDSSSTGYPGGAPGRPAEAAIAKASPPGTSPADGMGNPKAGLPESGHRGDNGPPQGFAPAVPLVSPGTPAGPADPKSSAPGTSPPEGIGDLKPGSPGSGGAGDDGTPHPFAPAVPPVFPGKEGGTPIVRPGPRLGNRDWIIPIECAADGIILYPARLHFSADQLEQGSGDDNVLLQAVRQGIERRQATVLPGEPPYRPIIRFLVRPDAVRSYYLAYPSLERLHVPMKRENLEQGEEIESVLYGK